MYKITITETKTVRKTIGKSWDKLGPVDNATFGYTPETETVVPETREVYTQVVESLTLAQVIAAVNGVEWERPK